jgi:hypothetical protein
MHFGIIFSFFNGNFSLELRVLVFESLVEYFGLSFLEIVLGDYFFKIGDLFFIDTNFVLKVVDLNG